MKHEKTREYHTISARARELLKGEEGLDVEFKQSLNAMEAYDIAAFANSESGGTILVGIKEVQMKSGRQRGEVYGCKVGDKPKLKLIGKINNIIPQLEVDIIVENAGNKPFYRIEIPSGPNKPYCTNAGVYKIRDDGYSKPIMPRTMLALLMEQENQRFIKRFTEATAMLEEHIDAIAQKTKKELDEVEDNLKKVSHKADVIMDSLGIKEEE